MCTAVSVSYYLSLLFTTQIDFWDNVYGFNMRVIKDIAITEPLVDVVEARSVLSNAVPILRLDILTCTKAVRS
jgi:type I protein arginine methyltransferase